MVLPRFPAVLVVALVTSAPLLAQRIVDPLLDSALERLDAGRGFDALDILSSAVRLEPGDARGWYARCGVGTALRRQMKERLEADEKARSASAPGAHDVELDFFAAALTLAFAYDNEAAAYEMLWHTVVFDDTAVAELYDWEARFTWKGYPDPEEDMRPSEVADSYRQLLDRGPARDRDLGWHLEAAVGARAPSQVIEDVERLRALHVDAACLRTLSAWACNRLRRPGEALRECDAALALDPIDAFASFERGYAHAARGELPLAREDWRRSVELRPDQVSARFGLALLDVAEEKSDNARRALERLPEPLRASADVEELLAAVHARLMTGDASVFDFTRLVSFGAWFPFAPRPIPGPHSRAGALVAWLAPMSWTYDLEFLRPLVRVDGTAWDAALKSAFPAALQRDWTSAFASSVLDLLVHGHVHEALALCDADLVQRPGSAETLALRTGIERGLEHALSYYEYFDIEPARKIDPKGEFLAGIYEARTWLAIPGGESRSSSGWQRAAESRPDSIEFALLHARYAWWGVGKLADYQVEYYERVLVPTATTDAERAWQAEARAAIETRQGPTAMEVESLTKRLSEHPGDPGLLLERARAFQRKLDVVAALADVESARVAAPRDLAVLELRQRLHHQQGDTLARLEDCELALAVDAKNTDWRWSYACLLETLDRNAEALVQTDRVIEDGRGGLFTLWARARILTTLGRRAEAIAAYTTLAERIPGAGVELQRAKLRLAEHDVTGAIADLRAWNVLHTGDDEALRLLDCAVAESEGTDERTARLARIVASVPTTASAFATRANAHAERGEWQAAWDDFTSGLALDPEDLYTRMHRASVGVRVGKYAEAADDCRHVIAQKPEWTEFRSQLFDAYLLAGDWDAALAAGNDLLERDPSYRGAALKCNAIALHQKQDWAAAVAAWRKVLAYSSDGDSRAALSAALQNRAVEMLAQRWFARARDLLDEAVELTPADARAYYNRGFARYNCGDWAAAQRDNDTARKLDGSLAAVEFLPKPKPVELREVECPECKGFGASGGGGSWIDERTSDTSTVIRWDASSGYSSSTSITGSYGGFRWQSSSVTTCVTCNGTGTVWR